jgi:hypothetical protein
MLRLTIIALLLSLAGCQSFMQPNAGMTAEQISAANKDKSIAILCADAIGPYGTYKLKNISFDQNSIKDGGLVVSDDCKIVDIKTQAPPRAPVVPKEPTPVKPAP